MRKRMGDTMVLAAVLLAAVLLAGCGGSSSGDGSGGAAATTVAGTVLDRSGNPVEGAAVLITSDPVEVTTDVLGQFSATVDPGEHTVKITSADGVVLFDDTVTAASGQETTLDFGFVSYDPASDYAGKLTCKQCHSAQYAVFVESGHGFKLNPVVNGTAPTYPFSTAPDLRTGFDGGSDNTLGAPASYADVSFVIGGYGWKARMIDGDGYIVTGGATQYNLPQAGLDPALYPTLETWVGYNAGVVDKSYDQGCFKCHTTGAQDLNDPTVNADLPGFGGDRFEFPAIECEACHGAGKAHAAAPSTDNIVRDDSSSLCGQCHTRDGENRIASSGGVGKHHEQYDEWLAKDLFDGALPATGPHATGVNPVDCVDCHDPHASTKYDAQAAGKGLSKTCDDCHNDDASDPNKVLYPELATESYAIAATSGMAGLDCVDCHMPRISSSAVKSSPTGNGEPVQGDIRTHLFRIDLSLEDQVVTLEGAGGGEFLNKSVTAEYACKTCHNGVGASDLPLDVLRAQHIHAPEPASALGFVGKEVCAGCHLDTYNVFQESGHGFKLNPVVNGTAPTYPFSTAPDLSTGFADGSDNTLGAPASYADVAYVIGGFGWKARMIDLNGYIVTGDAVQWNLPRTDLDATYPDLGNWVGYNAGVVDKPYDQGCFKCHTTGAQDLNDPTVNPDLPGFGGDRFEFAAIECEQCHGPGEEHVAAPSTTNIVKDSDPARCGTCHTRDSMNRIAASGDFGKHHEQYDEWLALDLTSGDLEPTGPHSSGATVVGCNSCHNPHASTRYDAEAAGEGVKMTCVECHPGNVITSGGMQGLDCVDCHMPRISKSAVAGTAEGTGPAQGDIRTHLFRIDLSLADDQQFVDVEGDGGGRFMNTAVTGKFACKTCHNGVTSFNLDFPSGMTIH